MKKSRLPARKSPVKKILAVLLILILVGAGVGGYLYWKHTDDANKKKNASSLTPGKDATHDQSSEGSTFEVPDNVSPDAIKDYTLVTENETFKIRQDKDSDEYIITLYAIINRPDQYDQYKDQLKQYKQDALKYLSDHGVNVNSAKITYEPKEATSL